MSSELLLLSLVSHVVLLYCEVHAARILNVFQFVLYAAFS